MKKKPSNQACIIIIKSIFLHNFGWSLTSIPANGKLQWQKKINNVEISCSTDTAIELTMRLNQHIQVVPKGDTHDEHVEN